MIALALLLGAALRAGATQVTPVEKVIMMIKDLQTQVNEEGGMEAATYDKFACFCKSKTDEKTAAISEGETNVETLTSDIGSFTAARDQLDLDIQGLQESIAGYEDQVKEAKGMRSEEKTTFEAALADMVKAVSSLERAIDTLKAATAPSLAQIKSLVRTSLLMADAMDITPVSKKVVTMLLSEDQPITDVPVSDYDSHSGGIIETLEGLLNTFREKQTTLESDDQASESDYNLAMQAKLDQLKTAQESLEAKNKERTKATEDIATTQADLTETNAVLNDDRVYLKELTTKCETKAKLWDQRSQMRADELAALTQALDVLSGTVAEKTESTEAHLVEKKAEVQKASVVLPEDTDDDAEDDFEEADDTVAFVQKEVRKHAPGEKELRSKLVSLLRTAGKNLKSAVLSTLAVKVQEDPFVKIKAMIQDLIERLLEEEADEASHKGWCDTEISKTVKDRDYRLRDITEHQSTIESLNARKEKLTLTKTELDTAIKTLTSDLANQTAARAEESAEHNTTVTEAQEGEAAIDQAIAILSHFYGAAAQSKTTMSMMQQPDDEIPDAGFDSNYTGSQGASTGVLGMMDVIKSDFARVISETLAEEEEAKRDFVEYERATKMSIATKTTAHESTSHELTECEEALSTTNEEMRTQQQLFDAAVKTWQELLPGCVADPGMSYTERVERRNAEIAALKDAYCILNDEEAGCSGVFLQKRVRYQK
jgi:hypothetical protein